MDKLYDIPFFLPKNSNRYPNLLGIENIFMESVGAAVTEKHTEL